MPPFTELFERARQCQRAGDLRRAVGLYRQIVRAEPYHAEAWQLLAVCLHALGQAGPASEAYGKALHLRPSAELHCGLGLALGCAANGFTQTAALGSRQVDFSFRVDAGIASLGVAFALVMGALGGALPALSAMRVKPLEALR